MKIYILSILTLLTLFLSGCNNDQERFVEKEEIKTEVVAEKSIFDIKNIVFKNHNSLSNHEEFITLLFEQKIKSATYFFSYHMYYASYNSVLQRHYLFNNDERHMLSNNVLHLFDMVNENNHLLKDDNFSYNFSKIKTLMKEEIQNKAKKLSNKSIDYVFYEVFDLLKSIKELNFDQKFIAEIKKRKTIIDNKKAERNRQITTSEIQTYLNKHIKIVTKGNVCTHVLPENIYKKVTNDFDYVFAHKDVSLKVINCSSKL